LLQVEFVLILLAFFVGGAAVVCGFMAWLKAVVHFARNGEILALLFAIFFSPAGVVAGVILWADEDAADDD
jgi:cytochrome bd-type quinol oxidase subunit 1